MKITNRTAQTGQTTWKVGDFYLLDNGELRQIGHIKGKGYFVLGIEDGYTNDFEAKYYWKTVDALVKDHGRDYGMTKVKIAEIIVEEI